MKNAVLSIIVPVFNAESTIAHCLDSILTQTYKPLEIICVNDASSDDSLSVLEHYAYFHENLSIINKIKNEGIVSARKAGVNNANGEYIAFVDADDWVDEDYISNMMQYVDQYDCDMVASSFYRQFGDNAVTSHNKLKEGLYEGASLVQNLIPNMLSTQPYYSAGIKGSVVSKIFRKELLQTIQAAVPDEIRNGEDVALTYPYILLARKIYVLNEAKYHYVQYPNSMSQNTISDVEIFSANLLYRYLKDIFERSSYSHILLPQLYSFMSHMILRITPDAYDEYPGRFACFGSIEKGKNIVVYGAGRFGKKLYEYANNSFDNVLWVDKQYELYQNQGLQVESPSILKSCDFDNILISIIDEEISRSVKEELIKMGIASDKIRTIDVDYITKDEVVMSILDKER